MTNQHFLPDAAQSAGDKEYDREPVPPTAQKGLKSFVGMYAGEHCIRTELMMGPLFVAAGLSAFDVVGGLLIGNLLSGTEHLDGGCCDGRR